MKRKLLLGISLMLMTFISNSNLWGQVTYSYTGAMQTYVVPPGITSIAVEMTGAEGGNSTGVPHIPGKGGSITTTMIVTPGATLNIFVGQKGNNAVAYSSALGGWNGGGNGGNNGTYSGGGGGGASDIRIGGTALTDRVLVAGSGAGAAFNYFAGGDNGGNGGGLIGEQGYANFAHALETGIGGSQVAGGAGGNYYGTLASPGTLGLGGAGATSTSGGGGGGGYYGGGGGAWAGGGGGSSYADGAICSETTSLQGTNSGNGEVTITPLCSGLDLDISGTEFCEGDEAIFSALSVTGGTVTWDGGIVNGDPFTPAVGLTTYTATSTSPEDCGYAVEVLVNEYPTIIANASTENACEGVPIVFTGSGGATYDWDMGVTDGDPFTPGGLGTVTYTVIGYDEIGCDGTASVDVNVTPVPEVDASVSETEICEGETIIFSIVGDADTYEWDPDDIVEGAPYAPADGVETFTVKGIFDATGCFTIDVVTISLNPTPLVSASAGDGVFCLNETVVLGAGGDADFYVWDPTDLEPGIGTHTYTVSGNYEGFEGCVATASVTIEVIALPDVSVSADFENVCDGQEVTLTATGADEYTWSPGAINNGVGFVPGGLGTYTYDVTATSTEGCSVNESVTVTVVEGISLDLDVTPVMLGSDGEIDLTVTGGVSPYTFDWVKMGSGSFASSEDVTGLDFGAYSVLVTGASGCSAYAEQYVQSTVGVEEISGLAPQIYPNPTTDNVTIQIEGNFIYSLTDISGAVLLNGTGNNSETLSLNDFAKGIYFIKLNVDGKSTTMKVVKQ